MGVPAARNCRPRRSCEVKCFIVIARACVVQPGVGVRVGPETRTTGCAFQPRWASDMDGKMKQHRKVSGACACIVLSSIEGTSRAPHCGRRPSFAFPAEGGGEGSRVGLSLRHAPSNAVGSWARARGVALAQPAGRHATTAPPEDRRQDLVSGR